MNRSRSFNNESAIVFIKILLYSCILSTEEKLLSLFKIRIIQGDLLNDFHNSPSIENKKKINYLINNE